MFKKISIILIVSVVLIGGNFVFAKNDKNADIPEQDGVYDVPGHPELKVRVFVHKAGAGKPTPTPVLKCELDDPDSTAVVHKEVWKLPSEWTYNLNPNSAPSLIGSENAVTIAENAFAAWTNELKNQVSINRGDDTTITRKGLDGKNIITWGTASGSALGVTYIWYYPDTGFVAELDTILNTKFFWTWSGSSTCAWSYSYDAQAILTHELGHWFGLDDEYDATNYRNATMYGYGLKMDAKADTLTTGDILGVTAIYSVK